MIEKLISPGDKLELKSTVSVVLPDGTEGVKTYKSSVYDILDDGRLEILMPMEQQKLILLPVDGEYDVCFFSNGGMYRANVRIADRQKINNTYIVVAEMITNLHKFQRREYYRFNCVIDMDVRELNEQEVDAFGKGLAELVSEAEMTRGVIVDISGGGLRFVSREFYQPGGILLLKFSLPVQDVEKSFLIAAKVIYSRVIEKREAEYE
ncbi:MAG: flagellar brake protein, partial [Lachnospiraceae bacterium]|nr:flagellar brake protein [Lachnospiraceae bacterium]